MGPLAGVKVVELAGIGPAPFCAMLLADAGAEVLRIDRLEDTDLGVRVDPRFNLLNRGRRSVAIDLKRADGVAAARRLVAQADVLIEGFRPGVMERLGLGPDDCFQLNPRLVYGRVTGWGQDGPLSRSAGHDIDYIALAGVLGTIGPAEGEPVPPLNLVGDYGGGALYLAFGILAALLEARTSRRGQVVDAAMVDGAASLATSAFGQLASGTLADRRGANVLDGGAPWYRAYETADGKFMAVGAIEPKFYAELLRVLGLAKEPLPAQHDRASWPQLRDRFAAVFRTKTRDEWAALFTGTDACVAPVLSLAEARAHPHNAARGTFVSVDGVTQPAPAPRFSRTPSAISGGPALRGAHTDEALADWGFSADELAALRASGAIA
ncbi:MAG TPA: CaiB/BaiF CoA-transferase family protein [Candidatus Limnocylindria bacterium]|nr:CaiB/BaiF CoA-transferase family protein [Candidatus Limnocylindria bacterium]